MVEIIPAIMPDTYDDLVSKAGRIKGLAPYAQIDVMDGKFVPSVSWPYTADGEKEFKKLLSENKHVPHWEELAYEVDLMVAEPERVIADWIAFGARRIIVHLKSVQSLSEIQGLIERACADEEEETGCVAPIELGAALSVDTPLEQVDSCAHDIDVVQLMGIKKIGYQGEQFEPSVVERVARLRAQCPHLTISVDGGVNTESAPKLISAGATRLVSGSAIFNSTNPRRAIAELQGN